MLTPFAFAIFLSPIAATLTPLIFDAFAFIIADFIIDAAADADADLPPLALPISPFRLPLLIR